jgi:D-3-phosphoglycerate dehydrogenase
MVDTVEVLILDLIDWLTVRERTYEEVMEAWRTSCPRLPVWEDANDRGLIKQEERNGRCVVRATPSGLALLRLRTLAPNRILDCEGNDSRNESV